MLPRLPGSTVPAKASADGPLRLGGWGSQDGRRPAAAAAAATENNGPEEDSSDEESNIGEMSGSRGGIPARGTGTTSDRATAAGPSSIRAIASKPKAAPLPEWRALGHDKALPKGAKRTESGALAFQLYGTPAGRPGALLPKAAPARKKTWATASPGAGAALRPSATGAARANASMIVARPRPATDARLVSGDLRVKPRVELSADAPAFVPAVVDSRLGSWAAVASMAGEAPRDTAVAATLVEEVVPEELASERPASVPACTFFVSGSGCRYGEHCRLRHPPQAVALRSDVAAGGALPIAAAFLARGGPLDGLLPLVSGTPEGWAQAQTWRGAEAAAVAELEAKQQAEQQEAGVPARPETRPVEAAAGAPDEEAEVDLAARVGILAAECGLEEGDLEAAELLGSEMTECGICMEHPARKQREASSSSWAARAHSTGGAKFGLLSGCAHSFCLECIRKWRSRRDVPVETARGCPVCRARSHLVVPCERFVQHPVRRGQVLQAYRARLATIPCTAFSAGAGECPFGSSCFYEHRFPDGRLQPKSLPRLYFDGKGNVGGRRGMTLADFV